MTETRMFMLAIGVGMVLAAILIWVREHLGA
jgi:hypothetical protein